MFESALSNIDPFINCTEQLILASGLKIQVNLITLCWGSMETDRVISEPCYNEVVYNRHITK